MALILVHEPGKPRPRVYVLPGTGALVGRASADLVLPNVSVSRSHCRVVAARGGGFDVRDEGSNNGTLLNGAPLTGTQPLGHKDKIGVGKYELQFLDDDLLKLDEVEQLAALSPYTSDGADAREATFVMSPGLLKQLKRQQDLRDRGALHAKGEPPHLPKEGRLTIGPKGDIPARALWPFGVIASVSWNGGGHIIERAGPFGRLHVNGAAPTTRPLKPGDTVTVGKTELRYDLARTKRR